ncbi:MAG: hypothetical protein HY304_06435 [candidate division Zixibacteria bacterium]|nr:hypothetical protein [candidate division Zixibacteria bacterium]
MKPITIIVDNLMQASPVVCLLQSRGVQVNSANLTAGHYVITGQCVILQISAEEFGQWTAEKTVFRRITDFKKAVAEPVVIIEGQRSAGAKPVSNGALRGALAFLAVHNRVPVLFAADENETADLIFAMANQVQNGMGLSAVMPPVIADEVEPSVESSGDNGGGHIEDMAELPEQIVRMLPLVGPVTAKSLLKRFGSLRGVFSASDKDLTKIDGIGPKKAKKIAAFLAGRGVH